MSIAHNHENRSLEFTLLDRLSKALDASGTSVQDMAEALDVSRNTVGNYLSGRSKINKLQIKEWAIRTGVPRQWLETGELPADPDTPDGGKSGGGGKITNGFIAPHRVKTPLWGTLDRLAA